MVSVIEIGLRTSDFGRKKQISHFVRNDKVREFEMTRLGSSK